MTSKEPFTVVVSHVGGRAVVQLHGEIDATAAPTFREALVALRTTGEQELSVDLSEVSFIDSSAVGVIGEMVRMGAKMTIVGASPFAQRVLDLTGLSELVTSPRD